MRDLFGIDLPEDRLEDEEEDDRKILKSKVRVLDCTFNPEIN